jgi:hypothetical protein
MSALGAHTTLLRLGGCRQLLQRASTTGSLSQIAQKGFLVGGSGVKASKAESCAERLLGRNALFGSSGAQLLRQSGICSVGFRGMVSVPNSPSRTCTRISVSLYHYHGYSWNTVLTSLSVMAFGAIQNRCFSNVNTHVGILLNLV